MQPATTEKEYDLRFYDVDYKRRLTVSRMINFFEDTVLYQSERLGVGLDYLHHNKIAWIVNQWNIRIERYPQFPEKIRVKTVADGIYKFYGFRRFEILGSDNTKMVAADSTWVLIDAESRRPMKIPEYFYQAYGIDRELTDDSKVLKLREPLRVDSEKEFRVRWTDMDINNHVNNVKYFEWIYESMPHDLLAGYFLKTVKLTYRKEAKYGGSVTARSEVKLGREEYVCYHRVVDEMKAELCFAETEWKKES